jgi:hypothetical protein
MGWLKEQDVKLAKLRLKWTLRSWRFAARFFILLGGLAEITLFILLNEELIKAVEDSNFGALGWYLERKRRREWLKKHKERANELLEEEYDMNEWAEELLTKRMRLEP